MTNEQYERWKDFALRMARTCFNCSRRPSRAWIIEKVEEWFFWWDYQKDWGRYSSWDGDKRPLCDRVSEFYYDEIPWSRCKACDHDDCRICWPHFEKICRFCEMECTCHEREDRCYRQFDDQWLGPVRCCLRAGIDFACEPSAGVGGFTAGDLRRMYPEGVPEWIAGQWFKMNSDFSAGEPVVFAELDNEAGVWL